MFSSVSSCPQAKRLGSRSFETFLLCIQSWIAMCQHVLAKHTQSAAGCQRRALFISWSGFEVKGENAH